MQLRQRSGAAALPIKLTTMPSATASAAGVSLLCKKLNTDGLLSAEQAASCLPLTAANNMLLRCHYSVVALCTAGSGSGPLEAHPLGSGTSAESQEDAGQRPPGNEAVAGWDSLGCGDSPPSNHLTRGPARRRKSRLSACSYADEAGAWQVPAARPPAPGVLPERLQLQQAARSAPATMGAPMEEGEEHAPFGAHQHPAAGDAALQRLGSAAAGSLSVQGASRQASFQDGSRPAKDETHLQQPGAAGFVGGRPAPAALVLHAAQQPTTGACSPPAADGTVPQQPAQAQRSTAAVAKAARQASLGACSLPAADGTPLQQPAEAPGSTDPAASLISERPPVVSPFATAAGQTSLLSDGSQAALQPGSGESGGIQQGPLRLPAIRIASSLPAATKPTHMASLQQAAEEQAGAGGLMASSAGSGAHLGSSMDSSTTAGSWLGEGSDGHRQVPSGACLLKDDDRLSPRSSSVQAQAAAPAAVTMWRPKKADSAPSVIDCGESKMNSIHDWENLWQMRSSTRFAHQLLVARGAQLSGRTIG